MIMDLNQDFIEATQRQMKDLKGLLNQAVGNLVDKLPDNQKAEFKKDLAIFSKLTQSGNTKEAESFKEKMSKKYGE